MLRRLLKENTPSKKLLKYLGTNRDGLIEYLESHFKPGMNWDNYCSVWVLDHIVSLWFFDLHKESDLELSLNYQNLLPMFKEDNHLKEHCPIVSKYILEKLQKTKENEMLIKYLEPKIKDLEKYWM